MNKKIIVIGLLIISIIILCGCTNNVMITEDTEGTLIDVRLDEGKLVVEFGNNSKAILSGIKRYDNDGIDWYEYLKTLIGKNIRITWYVNNREVGIISVENLIKM